MKTQQADLKSIFSEAVERPAGPDRRAYLERACGDDPALRDQVEELLAAHDRSGGFLGTSPGTAAIAPGAGAAEDATRADFGTAAARVPGQSATDGGRRPTTRRAHRPPPTLRPSGPSPRAPAAGSGPTS